MVKDRSLKTGFEKWNYHKSRVLKKFAMNNDYAKKCLNADFTYKSADKIIKASGLSVDDLTVAVCDVDLDARITSITEMDESDIKAFAEDVDLPKDVARDMMIMMTMHVKYNLKKLCDENPGAQINNLREVIYASVVSMCEKLAKAAGEIEDSLSHVLDKQFSEALPPPNNPAFYLGCYGDSWLFNKAFDKNIGQRSIADCAKYAQDNGYKYYGMAKYDDKKNKGKCYLGSYNNFDKHGESEDCDLVGEDYVGRGANALYELPIE